MTASALNTASIAPAAQPGAGASANAAGAGSLAGFESLLAALFPQADPTAAIPTAGQAAAAMAGGSPKILDGLIDDTADKPADGDATDADALVTAEAPATAGDPAALAAAMMVVQPAAPETPVTTAKNAGAEAAPPFGRDKAKGAPAAPAVLHANPNANLAEKAADAPEAGDAAAPAAQGPAPAAPEAAKPAPQARNTASAPPAAAAPPPAAPVPEVQPDVALAAAVEAPVEAPAAETAAVAASLTARPDAASAPTGRAAKADRLKASNDPSAAASDDVKPIDAADKPVQAKVVQGAAKGAANDASATVDAAEAKPEETKDAAESADATLPADTRVATQAAASSHSTHGVRAGPETVASLAAQMVKKLGDKTSRFDVQLDPHGLGKVDVRIEIGATGRITAGMTFDSPQAAADVKARANELQRALEQAGFDISGGISFDVAQDRGQSQQQNQAWQDQADAGRAFQGRAFRAALETAGDAAEAANQGALRLRRGVNSGLDLRI